MFAPIVDDLFTVLKKVLKYRVGSGSVNLEYPKIRHWIRIRIEITGSRLPPAPLPLCEGKAGSNQLNQEITPSSPLG